MPGEGDLGALRLQVSADPRHRAALQLLLDLRAGHLERRHIALRIPGDLLIGRVHSRVAGGIRHLALQPELHQRVLLGLGIGLLGHLRKVRIIGEFLTAGAFEDQLAQHELLQRHRQQQFGGLLAHGLWQGADRAHHVRTEDFEIGRAHV